MPRAGDYENVSSLPQVNIGTKRMAKAQLDTLMTVLQGGESSVGYLCHIDSL